MGADPTPAHVGSARSLTQPGQQGPWHLAQDAGGIPCWVAGGKRGRSRPFPDSLSSSVKWSQCSTPGSLSGLSLNHQHGPSLAAPPPPLRGDSRAVPGGQGALKVGGVRSEHGAPFSGCSGLRTGSSQPTGGGADVCLCCRARAAGRAVLGAKAGRDADGGGGRLHTSGSGGQAQAGRLRPSHAGRGPPALGKGQDQAQDGRTLPPGPGLRGLPVWGGHWLGTGRGRTQPTAAEGRPGAAQGHPAAWPSPRTLCPW